MDTKRTLVILSEDTPDGGATSVRGMKNNVFDKLLN